MRFQRNFFPILLYLFLRFGTPLIAEMQVPDSPPPFSEKQQERLDKEKHVIDVQARYLDNGILEGDGAGYIVIDATPDEIFEVILDFNRYDEYYPFVKTYSLYDNDKNGYGVFTELSAFRIIQFAYYHKNRYDKDRRSLVWTLDPDHESEFLAFEGYWKTWPMEGGKTLLGFVGKLKIESSTPIPAFLARIASEYALKTIVVNMKERVESGIPSR